MAQAQAKRKPPKKADGSAARLPLVAGGAALAGAAGGVALGSKLAGRRVLGITLPRPKRLQLRSEDVAEAARNAAGLLEKVGRVAGEAGDVDGAARGRRSSPLEVLLQGLTARR